MQNQTKFNFTELMAYLLPGSILFAICVYFFRKSFIQFLDLENSDMHNYWVAVGVLTYIGASYATGHVCSVWTRQVLRPFLRLLVGNPREIVLESKQNSFYSDEIKTAVKAMFEKKFDLELEESGTWPTAPRLIRIYVLDRSPYVLSTRSHIVRIRSLLGNLSLPLLTLSIIFSFNLNF